MYPYRIRKEYFKKDTLSNFKSLINILFKNKVKEYLKEVQKDIPILFA